MIPILMYHQVANVPRKMDPIGLAISPELFEMQMSYLARNKFSCLSLYDVRRTILRGDRFPKKSFVITFDDGYQNIYSAALPIMNKYGFTATIFLVAGYIDSPGNWWLQNGSQSGRLLSWNEIKDLAQHGFLIGSHTRSHPFLPRMDSQSAFEEISSSKTIIEENLNIQVEFFSYPYSETELRIERLVESVGYKAACAGDSGPLSLFHLWRVPCFRQDSLITFRLKVNGWYDRRTSIRESAVGRILLGTVRRFKQSLVKSNSPKPDVMPNDN